MIGSKEADQPAASYRRPVPPARCVCRNKPAKKHNVNQGEFTMPNRIQFPATIEPLVQFIEETPPAEVLDRTLAKLRAGVPAQTMLTASALAVARSSDLPPGHH